MKALLRVGVGQMFVVIATLVPVIAKQNTALTAAVFCGSVAGLFLMPLLMAIPSRLPGIADDRMARRMVAVSGLNLVFLVFVTLVAFVLHLLIAASGATLVWFIGRWNGLDVLIGVLLLMVAQGAYSMMSSWYTRKSDMRAIARLRMSYGVAAIGTALISVIYGDGFFPVILASACGLLVSSAVTFALHERSARSLLATMRQVGGSAYLQSWRAGWGLALAAVANGFTAQATALVLPALGALADAWAIVLRVGGGFTTTMQTVVAPFVEKDLGRAARSKASHLFRFSIIRGWMAGLLGAVLASASGVLAVGYAYGMERIALDGTTLGVAAACLFGGQVGISAISRSLAIAGWQHAQLIWDVLRLIMIGMLVALLQGGQLLVAIAAIVFLFGVLFALLGLYAPRALHWKSAVAIM